MRTIIIASLLSLTAIAAAKDNPGTVEQTVMKIEKELLDAALKNDASVSERYLADTYIFTGPNGMVENKSQAVADLKTGDLKLQQATLDDAKVQVYGDTAVVTYASKDKGTFKGKDITGNTRWTDVFVKRNGRWQVVASHGSSVTQ